MKRPSRGCGGVSRPPSRRNPIFARHMRSSWRACSSSGGRARRRMPAAEDWGCLPVIPSCPSAAACLPMRRDGWRRRLRAYRHALAKPEGRFFSSFDRGIVGDKARHNLACVYADMGRMDLAEIQCREVLDASPDQARARHLLIDTLLRQQRLATAELELTELEESEGESCQVLLLRARLAETRGRMAVARKCLTTAAEQFASDPAAWERWLGTCLSREISKRRSTRSSREARSPRCHSFQRQQGGGVYSWAVRRWMLWHPVASDSRSPSARTPPSLCRTSQPQQLARALAHTTGDLGAVRPDLACRPRYAGPGGHYPPRPPGSAESAIETSWEWSLRETCQAMITGVVLARNEKGGRSNIVDCLTACGRVAELILIDMESSDRTVELAPLPTRSSTTCWLELRRRGTWPWPRRADWMWFVDADDVPGRTGWLVAIRRRGGEFDALTHPPNPTAAVAGCVIAVGGRVARPPCPEAGISGCQRDSRRKSM